MLNRDKRDRVLQQAVAHVQEQLQTIGYEDVLPEELENLLQLEATWAESSVVDGGGESSG